MLPVLSYNPMIYKGPGRPDTGLPDRLVERLLDSVTSVTRSSAPAGRIRSRLLDRVRGESPEAAVTVQPPAQSFVVPAQASTEAASDERKADTVRELADAFITLHGTTQLGDGWVELLPKAHARLLFTNGQAESYMIRLEPGAWAPAHEHPADEECLVLEGSLWQGDVYLKAGDFHVARPGMKHGELRTDTGAVVFIRYGRPLAEYIRM